MYSIRHILTVQAPPQMAYQVLVTEDFLQPDYRIKSVHDSVHLIFSDGLEVSLSVNESIPGHCLVLDKPKGNRDWDGTEVTFDISVIDAYTSMIRFEHSNWKAQTESFAACNFRWAQFLDKFRMACAMRSLVNN